VTGELNVVDRVESVTTNRLHGAMGDSHWVVFGCLALAATQQYDSLHLYDKYTMTFVNMLNGTNCQ